MLGDVGEPDCIGTERSEVSLHKVVVDSGTGDLP
jgi:hypothetical protein